MLSNFIRRNAKRKESKGNKPHQKSYSSSSVVSPMVFNINDDLSCASTTHSPLLVQLNLPGSHEDWFPPELLRSRSCSPEFSLPCGQSHKVSRRNSREVPRADPPAASPPKPSEEPPPRAARKKTIPAPIFIPDVERRITNIQIGRSAVTTPPPVPGPSQPHVNGLPLIPPPSPSPSDDLSAISGTTLARALIASSFVLSNERRSSRHRSVARQDSATLPRRESVPKTASVITSPIPPVPPLPPALNYTSAIKSGASTESEYPMSDAYITSPEIALSSDITRGFSRTGEASSGTASASTALSVASDTVPKEKTGIVQARLRPVKDADFDVPETAIEVSLPENTQSIIRQSSQESSFSDDHSLDEFDFMPPEPLVMIASPGSDSSASFSSPVRHCNDTKRRRRVGGSDFIRNGSKDHLDPAIASQQAHSMPSATASDYGELLHCDLTLSPDSSSSSNMESSQSAGYQTFPETPMVFSPLFSPAYTLLSRSETQVLRVRPLTPKSPRVGLGQNKLGSRVAFQQVDNKDDKGGVSREAKSSLSGQDVPLPKQLKTNPAPPVQMSNENDVKDETDAKKTVEPEMPANRVTLRPHPLAHSSTSSSCVPDEEALQALAQHSPAPLPSPMIGDDGDDVPTSAPADRPVELPVVVAFPRSTDKSASHSLALGDRQTAVSSSATPRSLVAPTVAANSQPKLAKAPLAAVTSFGESFLPSPSPLAPSEGPLSSSHSPGPADSSAVSDLSVSPSFFPPPPYHTVVSERTAYHPGDVTPPALSSTFSDTDVSYRRSRQASSSSNASGSVRGRGRSRPAVPLGPRKQIGPSQVLGAFDPQGRKGSMCSVGDNDLGFPWVKLQAAASTPPPKFHMPPPKWRGLTLEVAQWTFTSEQLQEIVSRAVQQSSEGSSIRLLRLEVLEGEVADEVHRLELQHTDIKAQYKALWRKRWTQMGTLARQIEGAETGDASQTMEALAETLVALDHITDRMHDVVLQISQLKSLRDVHNASALALAVRKINGVFVRQMAEKERLQTHLDTLTTERDEAWKHAEDIARDYDTLNDRVLEAVASEAGGGGASTATASASASPPTPAAAASTTTNQSTRISTVRHSCRRLSRAGLRSRSQHRHPSDAARTRPSSLTLDDPIPPVPRLTVGSPEGPTVSTGMSLVSTWSYCSDTTEARALAAAQRDVYDMLGLSVPPSGTDVARRRTLSSPVYSTWTPPVRVHVHARMGLRARPLSEALHVRARGRAGGDVDRGRATQSVVIERRRSSLPPSSVFVCLD